MHSLHRRGALVDALEEMRDSAALMVLGKKGEHHAQASGHLGANLERVVRSIHRPLLVVSDQPHAMPPKTLLIAYDGAEESSALIAHLSASPLYERCVCHLVHVSESKPDMSQLEKAAKQLDDAGMTTHYHHQQHHIVATGLNEAIETYQADMLIMGAYGHSRLRHMLLGSTTTDVLKRVSVPILLVH